MRAAGRSLRTLLPVVGKAVRGSGVALAHSLSTIDDATAALQAKHDENTCREPLEYEDLEELGRRL